MQVSGRFIPLEPDWPSADRKVWSVGHFRRRDLGITLLPQLQVFFSFSEISYYLKL